MLQDDLIVHQQEERSLLKIALLAKQTSGALNVLSFISSPATLHRLSLLPKLEKALESHQKNYFWIRNSWGHTSAITMYDFTESLKQLLAGSRDLSAEYRQLTKYRQNILAKKSAIARRHRLSPWLRRMFGFFSLLSLWRDERKAELQKTNHYLEMLGREIARRSKLEWNDVKLCDPLAIKALPVTQQLVSRHEKLFKEQYLMVWDGRKAIHLSKQECPSLEKALESTFKTAATEIRGMIACPGKAKGKVVIINKKNEFNKMAKGKILVTDMTRPEFVPLMKQAAAIVTDEGGVTSHAAIISRELKVPCIIGTQVATKVLKDGLNVSVNANHGVVTVLDD